VEQEPDLFGGAEPGPESTLRRLAFDSPGPASTSTRPPAVWIWGGILAVTVVVIAVGVWVAALATGNFGQNLRTVPAHLVGATESSATSAVRLQELVPVVHHVPSDTVDAGTVIRTDPTGGQRVEINAAVNLWISTGKPKTTVPTLADEHQDAAESELKAAGLVLGPVSVEHSKTAPEGTVLRTDPAAGKTVDKGTRVRLVVSDGKVALGDLRQQTVDAASRAVSDLGLTATVQSTGGCGPASDTVVSQSVMGDVPQGSEVVLTYCDGSPGPTPAPTDTGAPGATPTPSPEPTG
jgi:serine/threonine-protein kinase